MLIRTSSVVGASLWAPADVGDAAAADDDTTANAADAADIDTGHVLLAAEVLHAHVRSIDKCQECSERDVLRNALCDLS